MITACLSWFDEPVELLERAVRSLAGVADRLVAVDGRWDGFPGEATSSGQDQHEVIAAAATAARIEATIVDPGIVWPDQVAKRTVMFELAPKETDWYLIIDGDEHLTHGDGALLARTLAETDRDVAELPLTNLAQHWPLDQLRTHTYTVRRLFRAAARPAYQAAHNGVRTPAGVWLSGDLAHVQLADAADASAAIAIGHSIDGRPAGRQKQRSVYYRSRFEDWQAVA